MAVAFSYLNCNIVGPSCQSSSTLKFLQSWQQGKMLVWAVLRIYVEKTVIKHVWKWLKTRCLVELDYITDSSVKFLMNLEM